jgi:methylglutaconyl-CoA hydratase
MRQTIENVTVTTGERGITSIVLNRPERSNALSSPMIVGLMKLFEELSAESNCRVVLIRANGKHFCTGADLAQCDSNEPTARAEKSGLSDLLGIIDLFSKPTVAVVQGACVGGGVALASCCDVVIARNDAFFSFPELRLGLVPGNLLPYFVRSVGIPALRRYGLSGERFDADEALHYGLVHQVVTSAELDVRLDALTDALLHSAPGAVRLFKRRLRTFAGTTEARDLQADDPTRANEIEEGKASFREKRKPVWYPPPVSAGATDGPELT